MSKPRNKKSALAEALKHSDDDLKRYIGAITEEYQERVTAIAEEMRTGFTAVNGKLDDVKEDIEVMKGDIATINFNHITNVDKSEFFGLRHRVEMLERKGRK